jgi:hypothetical protein
LTQADREVLVCDGWAVELGTFEWTLQPAAGGSAVVDRGNYMQVWQQQRDKKWRFAREVYNSSAPPARPPRSEARRSRMRSQWSCSRLSDSSSAIVEALLGRGWLKITRDRMGVLVSRR